MDIFKSQEFHDFLRRLGVQLGQDQPPEPSAEPEHNTSQTPTMSLLQLSRSHEALYRLDLMENQPTLRVLLPVNHTPLGFTVYQVALSEQHPLRHCFADLACYSGSDSFEDECGPLEERLLFALGEQMKQLFWDGFATSTFPPEILVQKVA